MTLNFFDKINWKENIKGLKNIKTNEIDILLIGLKKDLMKGRMENSKKKIILLVFIGNDKSNQELKEIIIPRKIRRDLLSKYSILLREVSEILNRDFQKKEEAEFFLSLSNYSNIYEEIWAFEFSIIRILKAPGFVRGLLNLVSQTYWEMGGIPEQDPITKEKGYLYPDIVMDGVSYLLSLLTETKSLNIDCISPMAKAEFDYGFAGLLISTACKVVELKQVEAQLTHMNYQIIKDGNSYLIIPKIEEIGIGLAWGHKRDFWAVLGDSVVLHQEFEKSKPSSLEKFYNDAYEDLGKHCWKIALKPFERMVFIAPKEPFIDILKQAFLNDGMYQEELRISFAAYKEFCVEMDEMLDKEITDDMSIGDLLKILRFFKFYIYCLKKKIFELKDSNLLATENTYFMTWSKNEFLSFFSAFGYEEKELSAFLKIMVTELSPGNYIDIIYRPILKIGEYYCVVLSALDVYKMPRTPLIANKIRFYEDGKTDLVVRALEESFIKVTDRVAKNIQYKFMGQNGEIDLIVLYEDRLFVFEGKNTLMPYGDMETRTMINHLNKASIQLSGIQNYLENDVSRNDFFKKLGWEKEGKKVKKNVYGILINNRLFGGTLYNKYPVVHVHELKNFIESGNIDIQIPNEEIIKVKIWKGEKVTAVEIEELISGRLFNSLISKHINRNDVEVKLGKLEIKLRQYSFDDLKIMNEWIEYSKKN